jgi:ankyrin repeat protein
MSALDEQVADGNVEGVSLLLDHGANPNGNVRYIPLRVALDWKRYDVAIGLVKHGADIRVGGDNAGTILHEAAKEDGSQSLMEMLVANGAQINALDNRGRTPLMSAVEASNPSAVRFLLQRGANPSIKDNNGHTALNIANAMADNAETRIIVRMLRSKRR